MVEGTRKMHGGGGVRKGKTFSVIEAREWAQVAQCHRSLGEGERWAGFDKSATKLSTRVG